MSGKVILLVEDNADDVELTTRALRRSNVVNKLVVVGSGEEALEYLSGRGRHEGRDRRNLPQLVLLDLNLPRMSGLDLLRAVRADPQLAGVAIVVLTSSKEEEDVAKSFQLGANAYVRKPVDFGQFTEAVRVLGLFWLVLNEAPRPP